MARLPYRGGEERAVGRALVALGFDTAGVRPGDFGAGEIQPQAAMRGVVPGSRVSVTIKGGRVKLRDQGRVIAEAPITSQPLTGWMAAAPGGVLVGAGVSIGDGCGAWEYDDTVWLPLAPPSVLSRKFAVAPRTQARPNAGEFLTQDTSPDVHSSSVSSLRRPPPLPPGERCPRGTPPARTRARRR